MANGYIKLHRSIIEWGWIDDTNTLRLWVQLLCTVVWEHTEYKGITLEPGQRIASLSKLAKETKMTVDKVRTAKQHLCTTGEITTSPTKYGDLITVENWAKYQDHQEENPTANPTDGPKQIPRKFPSSSQENEEGKEEKNINNFARTPVRTHTHDANIEEFDWKKQREKERLANYYKAREAFRKGEW